MPTICNRRPFKGSETPIDGRCASPLKHTYPTRYCVNWPKHGPIKHCRMHGGNGAVGVANENYGIARKGGTRPSAASPGTYSRHLPTRLQAEYETARRDPERVALVHEIGLLATRQAELTQRLGAGDLAALWTTQRQCWTQFRQQQASGNVEDMRQSLDALEQLSIQGANDMHLWREIIDVSMKLATLRASEHKRLMDLQSHWGPEQVAARFGQFMHALWEVANERLPKETIRPFLVAFQEKIRVIDVEFIDVTPKT